MEHLRVFLGLLCLMAGLSAVAARFRLPLPIVLVIAGQIIAFIPGLPHVDLDPDAVLIGFLPPLIFSAAYAFPWQEFRSNFHVILWLAVGLVLVTMLAVGVTVWWLVPGMTLAAGLVLGAVVSPPDAVAATAILKRMHVPHRVASILEGESLVNDSSGLIAYHFAIAAVMTGMFSISEAAVDFIWGSVGGVAIGLLTGVITAWLQKQSGDAAIHIILSIVSPYVSYLTADHSGASGVLAVVATGLFLGRRASTALSPASRLQMRTVWNFATYLMNGAIFTLIGLQLPHIVQNIGGHSWKELALYVAVVCFVVVVVRFAGVFLAAGAVRRILPSVLRKNEGPGHKTMLLISWAGMRGVVSLAAAMAIPFLTEAGEAFPCRNLIIFLTFCVILFTLVVQGCTLPFLVKWMRLTAPKPNYAREMRIRSHLATVALEKLEQEFAAKPDMDPRVLQSMRDHYTQVFDLFRKRSKFVTEDPAYLHREGEIYLHLLNAVRDEISSMYNQGEIDEKTARKLEHEMDLLQERAEMMIR